MHWFALIFTFASLVGFKESFTEQPLLKTMTVSLIRNTKTFSHVMPKPPEGWKIDSFRVCSVGKRNDWKCNINIGQGFGETVLLQVNHAGTNDIFHFGNPVYADSFGIKVITNRFATSYSIKPD